MDWWTFLATSFPLLLIICFIDSNAVLELQQFFHDLSKGTCHLYQALLRLRRAATHFNNCLKHLVRWAQQRSSLHNEFPDYKRYPIGHEKQSSSLPDSIQDQHLLKHSMLHFLEGVCVLSEMMPSLMSAALTVFTAFSHLIQGGFYILAAMLRTTQVHLISQINIEKEKWDKEQLKAKEKEKKELQHAAGHPHVLSGSYQCFKM